MTRAIQKAFDLGLQDFIVVSAKDGHGMEKLFGRIVTLVRIHRVDHCTDDDSYSCVSPMVCI